MRPRATLSDDGLYRYDLLRSWSDEFDPECVCWIGLNPSTADAENDDPTIRRMMDFTKRWGYSKMVVVNLFAFRATDPEVMIRFAKNGGDIVGPANNNFIENSLEEASEVICAWGAKGDFGQRVEDVSRLLRHQGVVPKCLSVTKNGSPGHPLYLKKSLVPVPYDIGGGLNCEA